MLGDIHNYTLASHSPLTVAKINREIFVYENIHVLNFCGCPMKIF